MRYVASLAVTTLFYIRGRDLSILNFYTIFPHKEKPSFNNWSNHMWITINFVAQSILLSILPCFLVDTLWLTFLTRLNADATPMAIERGLTGGTPPDPPPPGDIEGSSTPYEGGGRCAHRCCWHDSGCECCLMGTPPLPTARPEEE